MAGGETEHLQAAAVYLGAAVVAVPLFKRLGLGSVLGYLTAGFLIGPHTLGLIQDADAALRISEFGVVLLLFVIGLELRPSRLWRLRMAIGGLGGAQVLLSACVIGLLAYLTGLWGFNLDPAGAVIAGAGLALSSTAFAVQILREKNALSTPYGDRSFAILLFQDLAIVPLLALVAFLAPPATSAAGDPAWWQFLKALAAVGAVYFVGRYVLRPLFHALAVWKADEVFAAAALLVVVAAALAMDAAGLSMAMGAFLAGVLLAESEFRHQLEADIEPFRGLMMGLFFIAVGMNIDLGLLSDLKQFVWGQQEWLVLVWIIFGALLLVLLKAAIIYGVVRAAGSPPADALKIGAVLCQGGEFGFVIFQQAKGAIGLANESLLTVTITISMALTPFIVVAANMLGDRLFGAADEAEPEGGASLNGAAPTEEAPHPDVIIAGFGRSGQVVARIMRSRGIPMTLIDNNPRHIRFAETFGSKVFFGDARRLDTLAAAGAGSAKAIFLCMNDRDGARMAVERIRERYPNLAVFASAYDRFSMLELQAAGAHVIEREVFESAITLSRRALEHFGDGEVAEDLIEDFRRQDAELLRLQAEFGAHEGLKKLREGYSLEQQG